MTHFSAPSHPLIHAFLLQKKEFHDAEKIIVETPEQGEKLLKTLEALQYIGKEKTSTYRLIQKPADIVESVLYDDIAIYPIETLNWEISEKEMQEMVFPLTKNMELSEEKFISWLSDHGYIARKSDDIGTYFRVGDTVSLPTRQGLLQISFFGGKIEDLFLESVSVETAKVMAISTQR